MSQFSKDIRQRIVREFAVRHNGRFNPTLFVEEVKAAGKTHPAFEWFDWDRDQAAKNWQVEQARAFARDLKVTFRIEEVIRPHSVRVRETEMPMVLSPMSERRNGGGYQLVDPEDPAYIAEHCLQAAVALRGWLNRYGATLAHIRQKPEFFQGVIERLEAASPQAVSAA